MAALKLSQKVESQIRFRYILDQPKITYTISIQQERNVLLGYKDKHKETRILSHTTSYSEEGYSHAAYQDRL